MFNRLREFLRPKYLVDCQFVTGEGVPAFLKRDGVRFYTASGARRHADTMNRAALWTSFVFREKCPPRFVFVAGHEDHEPGEEL